MIDLYTAATPNGRKISIMLEEVGLPYEVVRLDLQAEDQKKPSFTSINPNQKIPAIVDHDADGGPLSIFESGAILVHLAEKTGQLLPPDARGRSQVMQWLMYQMSHLGPIVGQAGHFVNQAPEQVPYAIGRFVAESLRIVGVYDGALADRDYVAGEYSIADIAAYPWIVAAWEPFTKMMPDEVAKLPRLKAWIDRLAVRPAVERGMAVPPGD